LVFRLIVMPRAGSGYTVDSVVDIQHFIDFLFTYPSPRSF